MRQFEQDRLLTGRELYKFRYPAALPCCNPSSHSLGRESSVTTCYVFSLTPAFALLARSRPFLSFVLRCVSFTLSRLIRDGLLHSSYLPCSAVMFSIVSPRPMYAAVPLHNAIINGI
jgi:hypothetical protein